MFSLITGGGAERCHPGRVSQQTGHGRRHESGRSAPIAGPRPAAQPHFPDLQDFGGEGRGTGSGHGLVIHRVAESEIASTPAASLDYDRSSLSPSPVPRSSTAILSLKCCTPGYSRTPVPVNTRTGTLPSTSTRFCVVC